MKYVLFIFSLLSTSLKAQDDDGLFFNKKGDSLTGKPIKLPEPNWYQVSTLVKVEHKRQDRFVIRIKNCFVIMYRIVYLPSILPGLY